MYSRRIFSLIATVLAGVLLGAIPAVANAGTLLSGYGGPGQGNQQILGSALVGAGAGGGGSHGGGATGAGTGSSGLASGSGSAGEARTRGSGHHGHSSAKAGAKLNRGSGRASGSGAYPVSTGLAGSVSGDSPTLGLSGRDVMLILLGLGALALTGALTRQLVRGHTGREGSLAKGIRRRTRGTD